MSQAILTLTAALEMAMNQWLRNDPQSLQRLNAIQGRVVKLAIRELPNAFYFFPSTEKIQILTHYEGDADATIDATMLGLLRSLVDSPEKALFDGSIRISGDSELGEQFQNLLTEVEFDWEEKLSLFTGDVIAHQFGSAARRTRDFFKQGKHTLSLDLTEYLQEEARLLPTRIEIDHFLTQVDTLRSTNDRLTARIKRLQERFGSPS